MTPSVGTAPPPASRPMLDCVNVITRGIPRFWILMRFRQPNSAIILLCPIGNRHHPVNSSPASGVGSDRSIMIAVNAASHRARQRTGDTPIAR